MQPQWILFPPDIQLTIENVYQKHSTFHMQWFVTMQMADCQRKIIEKEQIPTGDSVLTAINRVYIQTHHLAVPQRLNNGKEKDYMAPPVKRLLDKLLTPILQILISKTQQRSEIKWHSVLFINGVSETITRVLAPPSTNIDHKPTNDMKLMIKEYNLLPRRTGRIW